MRGVSCTGAQGHQYILKGSGAGGGQCIVFVNFHSESINTLTIANLNLLSEVTQQKLPRDAHSWSSSKPLGAKRVAPSSSDLDDAGVLPGHSDVLLQPLLPSSYQGVETLQLTFSNGSGRPSVSDFRTSSFCR